MKKSFETQPKEQEEKTLCELTHEAESECKKELLQRLKENQKLKHRNQIEKVGN